jgi:transcriptional regulator GlxA family with amidase domain
LRRGHRKKLTAIPIVKLLISRLVFCGREHGEDQMATTIGILLFDGAEEMDLVGPWQVFTAAARGMPDDRVLTVAERSQLIVCEMGMRVIPDTHFVEAPPLDIVLVPGGSGARREITNPAMTRWLASAAAHCSWLTSVCTGTFLLVGAGLTAGRRGTTHHDFIEPLRAMGGAEVVERLRFVRDGKLLTAGGVMSGIEMSLWLVERLYGPDVLRKTKSYIAYDQPPRHSIDAM